MGLAEEPGERLREARNRSVGGQSASGSVAAESDGNAARDPRDSGPGEGGLEGQGEQNMTN